VVADAEDVAGAAVDAAARQQLQAPQGLRMRRLLAQAVAADSAAAVAGAAAVVDAAAPGWKIARA
jgi:hypothetical protein